jgi:Protein of unknown function (DUF3592)
MPATVPTTSSPHPLAAAGATGCIFAFGGVWILGWSIVTLLFDCLLVYSVGRQLWAFTYSTTPGKVMVSVVDEGRDSDGDASYSPKIGYCYQVEGKQYESELRRYAQISTNGRKEVERILASYPVGKEVTVYYNNASHSDAVLLRGLEGMDLLMGLFMLPFNAIMMGGWAFALAWLRSDTSARPPPGVRVNDDGLRAVLRIYPTRPWMAALIGAGAGGFAMTFVGGFGLFIVPLFPLALLGWIFVLGVAGVAYYFARGNVIRLEIDPLTGQVAVQRPSELSRSFYAGDIETIAVDEAVSTDGEGGRTTSYVAVLVIGRESSEEERYALHFWSTRSPAAWVTNWLREKLRKE